MPHRTIPHFKPDMALDRWLRDEVVPVYDAMRADPGRARSVEQVAERLRAHHEQRLERIARGG